MRIKKVVRLEGAEEIIKVLFEHKKQKAEFQYTLIGWEIGIDYCSYKEKDDEDIYSLIHDWIAKNIEAKTIIKYRGKVINYN